MGFGVRIAPGVRIRVSSRGVRTSIGPRIARVHVGAGRTGFSTGVGPVSYYTSGGRRSSGSSRGRSGGGSYSNYYSDYGTSGRTQYEKQQAAKEIEAALELWTKAHKRKFPQAAKEVIALESVESWESLYRAEKKRQLEGVSIFAFSTRAQAKDKATQVAQAQLNELEAQAKAKQAALQAEVDKAWQELLDCQPDAVFDAITEAFGDNESKAACLDVTETTAQLLVLVPGIDVIPEKDWGTTASGNLSVKKMTAASRNSYYEDLFHSQTLATVKEGFAAAPGLTEIKVLVIRASIGGNSSEPFECIGYGTFNQTDTKRAFATGDSAGQIIYQASNDWTENRNSKLQVAPLQLDLEPEIQKILAAIANDDASHGTEAIKHVGVAVKPLAEIASAKPAARTSDSSARTPKSDPSKVADQILAIKVANYCFQQEWVTPAEIGTKFNLSTEEAKQMLYFMELVGVLTTADNMGKRSRAETWQTPEQIKADIRVSTSFRNV